MTDRELMQQALDALECMDEGAFSKEIKLLRARLAQPEPEPVAWMMKNDTCKSLEWSLHWEPITDWHITWTAVPLYTAPPQREWQGLTDSERNKIFDCYGYGPIDVVAMCRAIEAKLKEKNT